MNRQELLEILANENELSKAQAGRVLDTLLDTVTTTVKKGGSVQLVGFGTFKAVKRAARTGFNPREGKAIKIAASVVPKFVAGAKFKAAVDPKKAKAAKPAAKAPAKKAAKPAAKAAPKGKK
jgi:DNA-binding protein HU-beta